MNLTEISNLNKLGKGFKMPVLYTLLLLFSLSIVELAIAHHIDENDDLIEKRLEEKEELREEIEDVHKHSQMESDAGLPSSLRVLNANHNYSVLFHQIAYSFERSYKCPLYVFFCQLKVDL